jgi:hypothetical protein
MAEIGPNPSGTDNEQPVPRGGRDTGRRRRLIWRVCVVSVSVVLVALYVSTYLLIASTHVHLVFSILDDWAVLVVLYYLVYLSGPVGTFGSLAAIVFAIGWYVRWPAFIARRKPWLRGMVLLMLVVGLHGVWFQFGWVPFRPLCFGHGGSIMSNAERALIGPLTPEAAAWFVKTNEGAWGDGTARLSGTDRVWVRPAIALFGNEINWNFTSKVARRIADDHGLPRPDDLANDSCSEVERLLMAGGRAEGRAVGWGTWPWSTFDEDGAVVEWLRDIAR